jgi:hypothetical protein
MILQHKIQKIRIGSPGKFDEVFGLQAQTHPWLMESLYTIMWLDTGEQVAGVGSFHSPLAAAQYVFECRSKMIDRKIEDELLL